MRNSGPQLTGLQSLLPLLVVLLTLSCTSHHIDDWDTYQRDPNPPSVARIDKSAVVLRFTDERGRQFKSRSSEWTRYADADLWHVPTNTVDDRKGIQPSNLRVVLPNLYAGALRDELQQMRLFKSVIYREWGTLARKRSVDLAISGKILADGISAPPFTLGTLNEQLSNMNFLVVVPSLLLFTGVPYGTVAHKVELEIYAFEPQNPREILWRTTVNGSTSRLVNLYNEGWAYGSAGFEHTRLARSMLREARDELAKAFKPGGDLHARLR